MALFASFIPLRRSHIKVVIHGNVFGRRCQSFPWNKREPLNSVLNIGLNREDRGEMVLSPCHSIPYTISACSFFQSSPPRLGSAGQKTEDCGVLQEGLQTWTNRVAWSTVTLVGSSRGYPPPPFHSSPPPATELKFDIRFNIVESENHSHGRWQMNVEALTKSAFRRRKKLVWKFHSAYSKLAGLSL